MKQIAPYTCINGTIVPTEKASLPIADRGLRFGDGVFETIRITRNIPYRWEAHLARLEKGLQALHIEQETSELLNKSLELIRHNHVEEGILRIMVTRGEGSIGYLPADDCVPNVIIEAYGQNFPAITSAHLWVSHFTKNSANSLPAGIKHMQGLNSILAKMDARERFCDEALLLDDDGAICEASSGNIFWVKGNILHTPAKNCSMVQGTMRDLICALSPLEVNEGNYRLQDLENAKEVFLTNASWPIMAVTKITPLGVEYQQCSFSETLLNLINEDMQRYVDAWHTSMA